MRRFQTIAVCFIAAAMAAYCTGPAPDAEVEAPEADGPPPGTLRSGPAFEFNAITDDIYHATGTGTLSVGSNSVIIINEDDVMIVDSHITPAAAYVLSEELLEITDKPIRYVVDTHFHFDHAHGNQIFGPEVEIIGHEFTHAMLSDPQGIFESRTYAGFTGGVPGQVENLRAQVESAEDAEERAALEAQLQVQEQYMLALDATNPTPPTLSFTDTLTVFAGDREIRLIHHGRGHTGGDVMVFLPEERIIATGDFFLPGTPYMGDAYLDEWPDSLERLREIDFETVLPGHGPPFTDRARIDALQAYLGDLWSQIGDLREQGVSAEEAAERIDLTSHQDNYPNITSPGIDPRVTIRAYERMDEIAAGG